MSRASAADVNRLAAWQRRLATLVAADAPPERALDDGALSEPDRLWFEQLASSPGLCLTKSIRRSWCLARAASAIPLTLSVVDDPRALLEEWVANGGGVASFAEREAIALLDFVAQRIDPSSHANSVCAFERAVRAVRITDERVAVRFWATPEAVLRAAIAGRALPEREAQPRWLVVGTAVPGLWRHATRQEARRLSQGATPEE